MPHSATAVPKTSNKPRSNLHQVIDQFDQRYILKFERIPCFVFQTFISFIATARHLLRFILVLHLESFNDNFNARRLGSCQWRICTNLTFSEQTSSSEQTIYAKMFHWWLTMKQDTGRIRRYLVRTELHVINAMTFIRHQAMTFIYTSSSHATSLTCSSASRTLWK